MSTTPEKNIQVNIRQIKEEDIADVQEIDNRITGKNRALTYTTTPYSYVGGDMTISVVAEVGGQVVGFLFGRVTDSQQGPQDTALMQVMGVDPQYQRNGIGTALVQGFLTQCQKKGVKSVHTFVSWQDWWMLSFLNSLGFNRGGMAEFIKPLDD